MALELFQPAVSAWFRQAVGEPTLIQSEGWGAIKRGEHTLIAAPTGSGKTLAAFLSAIDDLVGLALTNRLRDETHVLYVSPLKALSNDIDKNLAQPLKGIAHSIREEGTVFPEIRSALRTGDTLAKDRAQALRKPPHIFVTTPESLFILLTTERGRRMLRTVRTVIVDEIHALARDKRGAHLALSLERLSRLAQHPVQRIGLSATQKPMDTMAHFLVGCENTNTEPPEYQPRACTIIDAGHRRTMDLALHMPSSPLEAVTSEQVWAELYDALTAYILDHKTTLIFVNTRRIAERVAKNLSERMSKEDVTAHHGSLSRAQRLQAEQRLKDGQLRALVATASLELGIDIGDIDLVCQIGSTRSIATFLQRVGRAGHGIGRIPKGRIFPLSLDELVECSALLDAIRRGELDTLVLPRQPLDILAQHMVAMTAAEELSEVELYRLVRQAWCYRELSEKDFQDVLTMLVEGFRSGRGRRGAYIHRDGVHRILRARKGARLAAVTSGGAIPDMADYDVVLEPTCTRVGTVHEDFAIDSMVGDIFQLGNMSYQIIQVLPGTVRVADAQGKPPTIPFWIGEAPNRTDALSFAVGRLRSDIITYLNKGLPTALAYLEQEVGLSKAAADSLCEYLGAAHIALGAMPTHNTFVVERFFDETANMHLVLHATLGVRLMRAWGLALRKRFCRSFNFELQAAATDDALVLSLGPTHSFPVEDVFQFLHSNTVKDVLIQALLDAPVFETRFRWNAGRALALLRFSSGKRVPPRIQRMQAQDLLAVAFPDQQACLENIQGEREVPDHPLVQETIKDCLTEAMDIDRLVDILRSIEKKEAICIARDLTEPSPLARAILNSKAYTFLDDAPLEERRTQAVISRRWLDPKTASDLGVLDAAAIERVRQECWPDPTDREELHDVLYMHGAITDGEARKHGWSRMLETLLELGRVRRLRAQTSTENDDLWIAQERSALWSQVITHLGASSPDGKSDTAQPPMEALVSLMRGRLEILGPTTTHALGASLGVPWAVSKEAVDAALHVLEREGSVFRGHFSNASTEEWCDRRLLARIHQYTINRLRREIEPVSTQDFLRFLFCWQHVDPSYKKAGVNGLHEVIEKLQGFEIAAGAWEGDVLPSRVNGYDPAWLDSLCLSGSVTWFRRSKLSGPYALTGVGPLRSTPILLLPRSHVDHWVMGAPLSTEPRLSQLAQDVFSYLTRSGASFYDDIMSGTGLLPSQVEDALGELVAQGRVTSDSFSGLRALITPDKRRRAVAIRHRMRGMDQHAFNSLAIHSAGRWNLTRQVETSADAVEHIARALLSRWGVVFRKVIDRESALPTWRELLLVYRRLEACGEIRGGRFVSGFSGEQYATPGAVEMLRKVRQSDKRGTLISVSASDPLNVVGILTPNERVTSIASNRIVYCDGVPAAIREAGKVRMLESAWKGSAWDLERALTQRVIPQQVRAYLGAR